MILGSRRFHEAIAEAGTIQDWCGRVDAFRGIATQIGRANEEMMRSCDIVLGVLDGTKVDSGTASEIGFVRDLGRNAMAYALPIQ
jgi:nucleoside 2-deoxyribosyltransferase